MRNLFLWTIILIATLLSSCSEDDIIPTPNGEYTNDTIPSFVIDAISNAKQICDSIGEIKDIKKDTSCFHAIDDKGNSVDVYLDGDAVVHTPTDDIHIDSTVKESKNDLRDTINNTIWEGKSLLAKHFKIYSSDKYHLYAERNEFYLGIKEYATYKETNFDIEKTDTISEPASFCKLSFKNSTCIVNSWDTIYTHERQLLEKYIKIKVEEQEFEIDGDIIQIEIKNDTAFLQMPLDDESAKMFGRDKYIFSYQPLEKDGTFSLYVQTDVINRNILSRKIYHNCNAYNYEIRNNGQICIFKRNNRIISDDRYTKFLVFDLPIYDKNNTDIVTNNEFVFFTKIKE